MLLRREHLIVLSALVLVAAVGVVTLTSRAGASTVPAGVSVQSFTAHAPAGDSRVTAVGVSLSDPRYRVRPMMTKGKSLSGLQVVAAIDGDFYNLQTGRPSGRLVIDGAVRARSAAEPSLVIDGRATAIARYPATSAVNVISGKPRLVVNGQRVADFAADGATRMQDYATVPRSAVAIRDGRLWLLACGEPGLTMAQWAKTLQARGFSEALNLDGGPSTGLVVENRVLSGQDVQVPTALVIVRR